MGGQEGGEGFFRDGSRSYAQLDRMPPEISASVYIKLSLPRESRKEIIQRLALPETLKYY